MGSACSCRVKSGNYSLAYRPATPHADAVSPYCDTKPSKATLHACIETNQRFAHPGEQLADAAESGGARHVGQDARRCQTRFLRVGFCGGSGKTMWHASDAATLPCCSCANCNMLHGPCSDSMPLRMCSIDHKCLLCRRRPGRGHTQRGRISPYGSCCNCRRRGSAGTPSRPPLPPPPRARRTG